MGAADAARASDARLDVRRADSLAVDSRPDSAGWPAGFTPVASNVPAGFLCTIPADYVSSGGDPARPPCEVEADRFSDRDWRSVARPLTLKIVSWNVEIGKQSSAVQTALLTRPELVGADVLLLQECPRNDNESTPPKINFARDLAQALKMDYVFAVEWDRRLNDFGGEQGVAILSKYPIGNVTQIRHTPLMDFYPILKQFGGRTSVGADLAVADQRVRLYSSHLCTNDVTGGGRAKQGAEIRADAAQPGRPMVQIVGGDLNTFLCNPLISTCNQPPSAEQVVEDFLADGWQDLLPGFNGWTEKAVSLLTQRLDWFFGRGVTHQQHAVLQQVSCSDHVPIVTTVTVP